MDAGEDAERKLGICAFYFSILIFKASDGGYRNGCLGVGWNSVYVYTAHLAPVFPAFWRASSVPTAANLFRAAQ